MPASRPSIVNRKFDTDLLLTATRLYLWLDDVENQHHDAIMGSWTFEHGNVAVALHSMPKMVLTGTTPPGFIEY